MTSPEVNAALHDAAQWWESRLRSSWCWAYLGQERRLLQPALQAGVGHAPPGWTTTVDHLRGRGHTDDTMVAAGLAHPGKAGNLIDRFHDRLVFPIQTSSGELVGFIGRAHPTADPDRIPKWLNSPESPQYRKGSLLYGLGEAAAAFRRGAMPVIVEGVPDVLAVTLASSNIAVRGVAPCGTALTLEHVAALRGLVGPDRPIAVSFDNDQAGRDATVRAWRTVTSTLPRWEAPHLLHMTPPAGLDPADLIQRGETDRLRHSIVRAEPLPVAVADIVIDSAGPLDHLGTQINLLRHLVETDVPYVHPSVLQRYLMHLTRRLDLIDPSNISHEMVEAISPTTPPQATAARLVADQDRPQPDHHHGSSLAVQPTPQAPRSQIRDTDPTEKGH